jgi:hypothetical protein
MPQCALCPNDVPQLCLSHILPEPFYAGAYEANGTYPIFSNKKVGPVMRPQQKGLRERLLCPACEARFSGWETYSLGQIFHRTKQPGNDRGQYMEFQMDYAMFKLFQMSILWRMGVASLEVFSEVQLGRKHEERLRAMLLTDDPGSANEYACRLAFVAVQQPKLADLIIPPKRAKRIQHHAIYYLIAGGMLWHYIVSSHTSQLAEDTILLKEDGRLRILKDGVVPKQVYMDGIMQVYNRNEGYLAAKHGRVI